MSDWVVSQKLEKEREFNRFRAENQQLKTKEDVENAMSGAMDEQCDANTSHCTCVPLLRAKINRLLKYAHLVETALESEEIDCKKDGDCTTITLYSSWFEQARKLFKEGDLL